MAKKRGNQDGGVAPIPTNEEQDFLEAISKRVEKNYTIDYQDMVNLGVIDPNGTPDETEEKEVDLEAERKIEDLEYREGKQMIKQEETLQQILIAISAIEESVSFLEETAKKNSKYRGKLVALVTRMRPIVRSGGMTESLKKALQRG